MITNDRPVTITFEKTDKEMIRLAIFISQLVREGVTFRVDSNDESYFVNLTGGY